MKRKVLQVIRIGILVLLVLAIIVLLGRQFYFKRITAIAVENKLYYNANVYCEVLASDLDIDSRRCLGSVRYESGETCRFYECKNLPEYLYVSLGWEYRLYKLCDSWK